MLNHVFALHIELLDFLKDHNLRHAKHFKGSSFILIIAFLADIFIALNHLNCQMQGGGVNIIEAEKKMIAF